jgi:VWFA-related protein
MKQAKKSALHFIETQLLPADEVALLTYSQNQGLVMHDFLTRDHTQIAARLGRARGPTSMILNDFATELEMPVPEIEDPGVEFTKMKIRQFAQDMTELAKALRRIAGFKHIILFSSGVSRQRLYDNLYDTQGDMAKIDPGIRVLFDDMTKEFASSSSPVYTINTMGARAQFQGHGQRGDHSLQMVSEVSGGMYFRDVTSYEEISESIQNATGNYYVLGYYIDEQMDGRFHEIKVEVKRPGCVVHAQSGYFNPKPFSEFSGVEKQLHLLELAMSDHTRLESVPRFSMIALPCSDPPRSNLMILAEIPERRSIDAASGRAEIVTLIFNRGNTIVTSLRGEINYTTLPLKRFVYNSLSSLKPGLYRCRVVIRDLQSGSGAVAAAPVVIEPAIDRGVRVFPPLLLLPETDAGYLRVSEGEDRDPGDPVTSLNRIYPFPSERLAPLIGGLPRGTRSLRAVVRTIVAGTWAYDVELELSLIKKATGERRFLDFRLLEVLQTTGAANLLEIDLPELASQEYVLEIVARESQTGTESRAHTSFRVR